MEIHGETTAKERTANVAEEEELPMQIPHLQASYHAMERWDLSRYDVRCEMKALQAHEGCLGKVATRMTSHVALLTEKNTMLEAM